MYIWRTQSWAAGAEESIQSYYVTLIIWRCLSLPAPVTCKHMSSYDGGLSLPHTHRYKHTVGLSIASVNSLQTTLQSCIKELIRWRININITAGCSKSSTLKTFTHCVFYTRTFSNRDTVWSRACLLRTFQKIFHFPGLNFTTWISAHFCEKHWSVLDKS